MIGLMAKKMMIDEWEIIMLLMLLNDLVQFASSVMVLSLHNRDQSTGTIFVGNRNRDWRSGSTEPQIENRTRTRAYQQACVLSPVRTCRFTTHGNPE